MKERLDAVYDDLTSTQAIGSLSVALEEAEEMSLRLVNEVDRATTARSEGMTSASSAKNFHAMGTRTEVGVRGLVSMVALSSGWLGHEEASPPST